MIGQLTGTVAAVDSTTAVVDVNGIGFAVRMPNADLATLHIGNAAVVHTEMMVSQDAITLYGFLSMESKRMFLQLLKVNGIGPKVALSLLLRCRHTNWPRRSTTRTPRHWPRPRAWAKKARRKSSLNSKGQ